MSSRKSKKQAQADNYIRLILALCALVVIGALLTAIFAIVNGVIDLNTDVPRTVSEYQEIKAGALLGADETAEAFGILALSQIENGRFEQAEMTIQQGRSMNFEDEEQNFAFDFAEAVMAHTKGDTQRAIELYENTMELIEESFDRMYVKDISPNWAKAHGLHPNFHDSALALAFLYGEQGDMTKKVEFLDIFLRGNPTAGDMLVERGNAKLELGDKEGAAEDFTEALRFLPNDELALEGLEKSRGN